MSPRTRITLRLAGVALLLLGIVGFALTIFVFGGAGRLAMVIGICLLAGFGLTLVLKSLPAVPGQTARDSARDTASVFFTFGTLGPLIMMVITSGQANFLVGLVGILVSGVISTLWALAFIRRAYWMIPIAVVTSAVMPPALFNVLWELGGAQNFGGLSVRARLGILGLESLATLIVGYALMTRSIARMERDAARREAELETAARIHAQLVPAIERGVGPWSVRGVSLPSSTMGGDLIDLIPRADGGADLVLADVTGHGVRAGVVMALAKGIVWAELRREAALADATGRINQSLADLLDDGTFVTAVVVRLPAAPDAPVEVLVAGHPPPIIRRADGATERVESHGLPWGVAPESADGTTRVHLAAGDAIVLYSDGISEAAPPAGGMFGVDGVDRAVRARAEPGAIPRALLDAASTHAGGMMDDDRSSSVVWRRSGGA